MAIAPCKKGFCFHPRLLKMSLQIVACMYSNTLAHYTVIFRFSFIESGRCIEESLFLRSVANGAGSACKLPGAGLGRMPGSRLVQWSMAWAQGWWTIAIWAIALICIPEDCPSSATIARWP
jgi:hypothetical protein